MTRPGQKPDALFTETTTTGAVRCRLCGHRCVVRVGKRGICRVRENQSGTLVPLAYGLLTAMSVDPIEKKPMFHFQPGSASMSIASDGCNLRCPWCQNHHMAQAVRRTGAIRGQFVEPGEVVAAALGEGCASVSYTYSEPTIHYEYDRAVGVLARARRLRNVFVTNGLMTAEVARDAAASFLDGANVDLKAMSSATYKKLCRGPLDTVLDAIRTLHDAGVWVEVTTLVVPGTNDGADELRAAARFLASVSPDLPWHLSRYHPDNEWTAPPTPVQALRRAREIGLEEGLRYVYTGNVWGDEGENTCCPGCGAVAIRRRGFSAAPVGLAPGRGGTCATCGARIVGVEMP
jgi:pyruvate formate lyase activating enzyme